MRFQFSDSKEYKLQESPHCYILALTFNGSTLHPIIYFFVMDMIESCKLYILNV